MLAGQAWDLFSPLNVETLNTNGNYWFGGNGGFRQPQLRGTRRFDFGGQQALTLAASVNSNDGAPVSLPGGGVIDAGRDSGIPLFQGSIIYQVPLWAGALKLGTWGLWGREENDVTNVRADQWGVGGHLVLPLASWATLKGEVQHGENLDAFLMGGGFDLATGDEIRATSGWAQLTLTPLEAMRANLKRTIYKAFVMGIEYQRFDTWFKDSANSDANLVWVSGIMNF